jgi:hypothetical protein
MLLLQRLGENLLTGKSDIPNLAYPDGPTRMTPQKGRIDIVFDERRNAERTPYCLSCLISIPGRKNRDSHEFTD